MKTSGRIKAWILSPNVLFVWTLIVLIVPNVALCFTEEMAPCPALVNVILPLSFYALVLSLGRITGKMVWWLFLAIFFAAFQIVLLFLFGNSIIGVDMFLNLFTTNPTEALEVLGNLLSGIATILVLYVPVLVASAWQWAKHCKMAESLRRHLLRGSLAAFALSLGLLAYTSHSTPKYNALNDLYPLNVCYNVKLTADRLVDGFQYEKTSAQFAFHTQATHPAGEREVYVLLIGETARADNFQIYGYERPTTPLLQADSALYVAFRDVTTQSNTTHKSVPMLLTAASASDYDRVYREKGIITAFKEAGFHTVFLSNQRRNHSYIDLLGEEANDVVFLKDDLLENHYDTELLDLLREKLQSPWQKLFVVVHLYGSHFNYRERYPHSLARFVPDDASEARAANRESLLNAYDNTILMTDSVVSGIFHLLEAQECTAAALYTSDHGENIYDDARKLFLHASPRPSYYHLRVPLLVYTSPQYREAFSTVQTALEANKEQPVQSNASAFHTMLGLAGLHTPVYADTLSLTEQAYRCTTRYYLNDHSEPVALPNLKLSDEDRRLFKQKGLFFK